MNEHDLRVRDNFPWWTQEIARFADTDQLGHINNAAYATYVESARTHLLLDPAMPGAPAGTTFVIARLVINFRAEMHWFGAVEVGSVVMALGRSSMTLGHGVFKDGVCTATAEAVVVLMDLTTRRSTPLPDALRTRLEGLMPLGEPRDSPK